MEDERVRNIIWTENGRESLKEVYDFVSCKSKKAAKIIKNDILKEVSEIVFINQYQLDEIEPSFRRIIVRDYKILYFSIRNTICISRVYSTKTKPK
ncbi:type II toxin-antitoxin system RelE/ParE family toxin [Salegentibacter sp. JZCK2]|uniref:type II toxin-antitoxin system RelE/ParE family toxin n=1 Tax=Salegentibacter tibetensis TaxID=2873600 RepID=UPI001CCAE496|nr:type II toxin-antitoxin system RelE/ParE family toxin [Salegentibacter tibetensis]